MIAWMNGVKIVLLEIVGVIVVEVVEVVDVVVGFGGVEVLAVVVADGVAVVAEVEEEEPLEVDMAAVEC